MTDLSATQATDGVPTYLGGSKALDLLRIGDLDRPALPLERVVDKPAPVIDSTTAQTGSPWTSSIRRASVRSASTSGAATS
jgi:hypothetical protein